MKESAKKIIAREFLFLLGTTILFFVILFIWTLLHNYNNEKEYELKQEIESLTESKRLKSIYKDYKQKNIISTTDFITFMSANDSQIKSLYNLGIEANVISPKTSLNLFRSAWEKYPIEEIVYRENKINKIKDSFFNRDIRNKGLLSLGFLIFSVLFLLRYLIYATIWSFKQLKK